MATTKAHTVLLNSVTLTAGGADTVSSAVDLADGYGASLNVRITNGGTGPTVAAQVQVEVSNDNSAYCDFGGPLKAGTTASTVYEWGGIEIPAGVKWARVTAGSNTGQNVTCLVDLSEVTAV